MRLNNLNFTTFCLAFILVGMPITYATREYLPIDKTLFSYLILTILLIKMIDFNHLFQFKFFNDKPKIFILLLIFDLLLFLIYDIGYGQLTKNPQSVLIVLVLLFFLALSTHKKKDFQDLLPYILIISSLTTIVSLTLNTDEWMITGRFYVGSSGNPNESSFIALINILSIFYYLYRHQTIHYIQKLIVLLISLGSLYIYILAFSKSAIIGLIFSLVFLLFIERKFIFLVFKQVMMITFIGIPVLLFLFPDILEKINRNIEVLQYAYYSYLYGEEGSRSAVIRYHNLKEMLNLLPTIELFSGNGIFTTRADQPLLQVFTDLGIVPGIINLLVMLIFPLVIVIKSLFIFTSYKKDPMYDLFIFSMLFFLFYFINNLFHGTPYEHTIWIPIIMLYKFVPWKKKVII